MNCVCKYTDSGPLVLCAAHDNEVQRAVVAERERCLRIVSKLSSADVVYPEGIAMLLEAIKNPTQ